MFMIMLVISIKSVTLVCKTKRNKMNNKIFGYYIFGGMLIGALLGMAWAGKGNPVVGLVIGALVGTAIGWFAAAYVLENQKQKKGK
jgi:ABC-type uncharacterized transport system permease subunit